MHKNKIKRKLGYSIQGFTLMELMITLSIMGIVLAINAPNLQSMISHSRLTTQSNSMVGALNIARSESIKRGKLAVVTKTGSTWQDGWEVFIDENVNYSKDDGELLIQHYEPLANGYTVNVSNAYKNYIAYRPDGRSNTNGSFYFCAPTFSATLNRVVVAASGRIRTESDGLNYAELCE